MESASALWWVLSAALIAIGVAGTVLPALPGVILVWAGILLGAWIDDFQHVSGWTLAIVSVLAVLAWAVDYVAAALGAQRAGASRLAMVGAAIGTVAGLLMGLVGVLFMPLVGAVVGEVLAQRRQRARGGADGVVLDPPGAATPMHHQALRVGLATWVGLLLGTVAKLVLVFVMIGLFVAALLI
ncbi:MAG: DUF456 domain-containing protein [Ideonella sp.]|nr:DUF456 domain-containing protein [Ideonella sp.]